MSTYIKSEPTGMDMDVLASTQKYPITLETKAVWDVIGSYGVNFTAHLLHAYESGTLSYHEILLVFGTELRQHARNPPFTLPGLLRFTENCFDSAIKRDDFDSTRFIHKWASNYLSNEAFATIFHGRHDWVITAVEGACYRVLPFMLSTWTENRSDRIDILTKLSFDGVDVGDIQQSMLDRQMANAREALNTEAAMAAAAASSSTATVPAPGKAIVGGKAKKA